MAEPDRIVTNLFYNGGKVIARPHKGTFHKADIQRIVSEFQLKYSNKPLRLMLSINTPYGFRSAKPFFMHEEPILVEDYEWETTNAFTIYCWKEKSNGVGANGTNSCLFDCIKRLLSKYHLPKDIKSDLELKKKLRLNPTDKIPFSLIPEVEKLMAMNINICGDKVHTSRNKFNRSIHLVMTDEHVTMQPNNNSSKCLLVNIPCKQQRLVLVTLNGSNVQCYDGSSNYEISSIEYNERKHDLFGESVYIDELPLESSGDKIKDYELFIEEVEQLAKLTKGKIDLSKSGYKITNEAMKCVHYSLLPYSDPEPVTPMEQEWIINAFKGGIIFADKVKLSHAYCYDKNSAYPSMLCNDHFSFPVKQGKFVYLEKLPEVLKYGIYRCTIMQSNDRNIDKLFRFNTQGYYTHFDINNARSLGLSVALCVDDESKGSNAILYSTDKANGAQYFRHIVHTLYELRSQSKLAKRILNAIWGALSQRNKINRTTAQTINLDKGEKIIDIKAITETEWRVTYLKPCKYFKHAYARLGCFLTSAVRKDMATKMFEFREHIYRCHTDSILSDVPLPLLIGANLGDFKLEKEGSVEIVNNKKPIWN